MEKIAQPGHTAALAKLLTSSRGLNWNCEGEMFQKFFAQAFKIFKTFTFWSGETSIYINGID